MDPDGPVWGRERVHESLRSQAGGDARAICHGLRGAVDRSACTDDRAILAFEALE